MNREARGRMTEGFVAMRDGYTAARVGGTKAFGSAGLPSYALDDRPTERTGDDLFRDFAHLVQARTH